MILEEESRKTTGGDICTKPFKMGRIYKAEKEVEKCPGNMEDHEKRNRNKRNEIYFHQQRIHIAKGRGFEFALKRILWQACPGLGLHVKKAL